MQPSAIKCSEPSLCLRAAPQTPPRVSRSQTIPVEGALATRERTPTTAQARLGHASASQAEGRRFASQLGLPSRV